MSKHRIYFLIAIAACLLVGQRAVAAHGVNGNLVTTKWLEQNLTSSDVLILDASSTATYAVKHIPGAVSMDLVTYGAQELPVAQMEKLYQSKGISPGKKIVLYDQGGSYLATRQFFALYYDGFPAKDLFILDGGLAKWQADGLPVTKDVAPPAKGSFTIKQRHADFKAELSEVLNATGDPANHALVDALGPDWHFGETHPFDRAGHIPRSILLPSADFFNADKTFKSPEEIARMLKYAGVRPEQQVYSYCGGGVAASAPWFAMKFLVNYPKVKLYVGSELEWLADERQLPYWTFDAPFLMRQSGWLQFWAGPMIRMYRGAPVSIVDVRPADAYRQGHVPFALNIPADVFRSNLTNPAKLAEILGTAGVDVSHEAVVISGAGVTKDSALAFAMLEKVGQKKVTMFTDSMDAWTQLGLKVTKDATAVGPKKGPMDVSIPPTTYPASLRNGVVIADPKSTQGVYPKVFIASGKDMPAKSQEGKIVHVPYTDLLNSDGTPKAPKDIWNILTKAGVPRYAELVCFADDPGEAAANYFVLKLMGYPDVKVLI